MGQKKLLETNLYNSFHSLSRSKLLGNRRIITPFIVFMAYCHVLDCYHLLFYHCILGNKDDCRQP